VGIEFRRSDISFQDYLSLVDAVARSWSRDGVEWLRSRFKQYRGHFGLLGNALLLHYASIVCVDAVPEPQVASEPEVRVDVAMAFREALLVLEVKVHHAGEPQLVADLDALAEEYGERLKRLYRVYLGVVHFFTHKQPPSLKVPKWVELTYLPPHQQAALEEVGKCIRRLADKLHMPAIA